MKTHQVVWVMMMIVGICFALVFYVIKDGERQRVNSECPPAAPTHYLICGDGYHKEVFVYKNGGYVCAEYGGVVEMGDNCTLVPLPPTTEAP